ncbi:MAG: c-type cytochrome [Ferruginibacter sp.]|nr:c-type cytochrome [Chitinophagaceae bacterium]MBP6287239.1 c-type cytochrome [Ferruginibacter sp.]MBU9936483.1 c-type cytochrome [Ferruginibacter sp.]
MKRKSAGPAICLAVLFLLLSVLVSCNNNDEKKEPVAAGNSDSLAKVIERGRYLANHVSLCMDCHSQRDFNLFSGPPKEGTEGIGGDVFDKGVGIPGVVYARNITPDTVNGIGKWTDEEIARAITRGINKNGDTLFPVMPYPYYNTMSKDDVYSIIAYIRTLKPSTNKVPERKLMMPVSLAYPPLKSSSPDSNRAPDVSDMVKYGAYVWNSAACMDCHTPMEKGQFVMSKMMAGGFTFDLGSFVVTSANLTPDTATGIGKWTEQQFLDKFRNYRDKASYSANPGKNNSIMPWTMYANMTDFDIKAIYRFLQTLPPVNNKVEKYPPAK